MTTSASPAASDGGVRTQRHRWQHHDGYNATCIRCGTKAQKRPHPYARYWFTEWQLPDGSYTTNFNGEPTPPCSPIGGRS